MNILVIAPHPDDETLGCGGTILKYKDKGHRLYWLILTRMSESVGFSAAAIRRRRRQIRSVSRAYGFRKIYELDFEATRLDEYPLAGVVRKISEVVNEVEPAIVFLPNRSDIHSDHRQAFSAGISCTKSFRYPFIKKILMYEVPSETDAVPAANKKGFCPNAFVDISSYMKKKISIMKIYKGELQKRPLPRSARAIEALAALRGAVVGCDFAESFTVIRDLML
ncbi:MAG: PIG-L family deacetylase [Candidatus Omnitrophica bacterium]|nr:PIG-L family deacetylase [Candidatus Omnitrophota bacterium]